MEPRTHEVRTLHAVKVDFPTFFEKQQFFYNFAFVAVIDLSAPYNRSIVTLRSFFEHRHFIFSRKNGRTVLELCILTDLWIRCSGSFKVTIGLDSIK